MAHADLKYHGKLGFVELSSFLLYVIRLTVDWLCLKLKLSNTLLEDIVCV